MRFQAHHLPNRPIPCPMFDCPYNGNRTPETYCESPQIGKGNSDSACFDWSNKRVLAMLGLIDPETDQWLEQPYPHVVNPWEEANGQFAPGLFRIKGGRALYEEIYLADGGRALYLARVEPTDDGRLKVVRRWFDPDRTLIEKMFDPDSQERGD